jgi:hypothetical protein
MNHEWDNLFREAVGEELPKVKITSDKVINRAIVNKETANRADVKQRKSEKMIEHLANAEVRMQRGEASRIAQARPEVRAIMCENSKRLWADEDFIETQRIAREKLWADEDFRQRHKDGTGSIENRKKISEGLAKPGVMNKRVASHKATVAKPEVKERVKASLKKAMNAEGMHEKLSAIRKNVTSDPVYIEKMRAIAYECQNRPEVKEKKSKGISAALRPKLSNEQKKLIKKALKKGPMPCNSKSTPLSWTATAEHFGLKPNQLRMYSKGENLGDLE